MLPHHRSSYAYELSTSGELAVFRVGADKHGMSIKKRRTSTPSWIPGGREARLKPVGSNISSGIFDLTALLDDPQHFHGVGVIVDL